MVTVVQFRNQRRPSGRHVSARRSEALRDRSAGPAEFRSATYICTCARCGTGVQLISIHAVKNNEWTIRCSWNLSLGLDSSLIRVITSKGRSGPRWRKDHMALLDISPSVAPFIPMFPSGRCLRRYMDYSRKTCADLFGQTLEEWTLFAR